MLPLSRHDPEEFYLFTFGYGKVIIDGILDLVRRGSAFFIPGGADHGVFEKQNGVEFVYGFAQCRLSSMRYNFSSQQEAEE